MRDKKKQEPVEQIPFEIKKKKGTISWDSRQWVVNFDKDPTFYFSNLFSMFKHLIDLHVKNNAKCLLDFQKFNDTLNMGIQQVKGLLDEVNVNLELLREEIESEKAKLVKAKSAPKKTSRK